MDEGMCNDLALCASRPLRRRGKNHRVINGIERQARRFRSTMATMMQMYAKRRTR